jgi:hypothetical protein
VKEPSIQILQSWSNWFVDYLNYVLLENISLVWTCHHCQWRAVKLDLFSPLRTFEQGGRSKSSSSCHTCFDTRHRSHPQHDAIPLCVVRELIEWGGPSDETRKTETPCYNKCGTIKIPPCSKALSAENRPYFMKMLLRSPWKLCSVQSKKLILTIFL